MDLAIRMHVQLYKVVCRIVCKYQPTLQRLVLVILLDVLYRIALSRDIDISKDTQQFLDNSLGGLLACFFLLMAVEDKVIAQGYRTIVGFIIMTAVTTRNYSISEDFVHFIKWIQNFEDRDLFSHQYLYLFIFFIVLCLLLSMKEFIFESIEEIFTMHQDIPNQFVLLIFITYSILEFFWPLFDLNVIGTNANTYFNTFFNIYIVKEVVFVCRLLMRLYLLKILLMNFLGSRTFVCLVTLHLNMMFAMDKLYPELFVLSFTVWDMLNQANGFISGFNWVFLKFKVFSKQMYIGNVFGLYGDIFDTVIPYSIVVIIFIPFHIFTAKTYNVVELPKVLFNSPCGITLLLVIVTLFYFSLFVIVMWCFGTIRNEAKKDISFFFYHVLLSALLLALKIDRRMIVWYLGMTFLNRLQTESFKELVDLSILHDEKKYTYFVRAVIIFICRIMCVTCQMYFFSIPTTFLVLVFSITSQVVVSLTSFVEFSLKWYHSIKSEPLDKIKDYLLILRSLTVLFISVLLLWTIYIFYQRHIGSIISVNMTVYSILSLLDSFSLHFKVLNLAFEDEIKRYKNTSKAVSKLADATPDQILQYSDKCAICHFEMSQAKITPCNHIYHRCCVVNLMLEGRYTCPLCRRILLT